MATPDFILDLRAHVGTSLLWVPGCTAVVIKEEGEGAGSAEPQILVVRRADNLRWTLVTGIIDPGEEPAIAAAREIWEETAVQARPRRLLGVEVVGPVTYDNGDESIYLDTSFAFEWESGAPCPSRRKRHLLRPDLAGVGLPGGRRREARERPHKPPC